MSNDYINNPHKNQYSQREDIEPDQEARMLEKEMRENEDQLRLWRGTIIRASRILNAYSK